MLRTNVPRKLWKSLQVSRNQTWKNDLRETRKWIKSSLKKGWKQEENKTKKREKRKNKTNKIKKSKKSSSANENLVSSRNLFSDFFLMPFFLLLPSILVVPLWGLLLFFCLCLECVSHSLTRPFCFLLTRAFSAVSTCFKIFWRTWKNERKKKNRRWNVVMIIKSLKY